MIVDVEMSPNVDNPEEVRKSKKRVIWFGYGGYAGGSDPCAFNPVNIRADPKLFDWLLELFGARKKTEEKRPSENRN